MGDLLQVTLHKQGGGDAEDPHVEDHRAENPHEADVEEPVRTIERKVLFVV